MAEGYPKFYVPMWRGPIVYYRVMADGMTYAHGWLRDLDKGDWDPLFHKRVPPLMPGVERVREITKEEGLSIPRVAMQNVVTFFLSSRHGEPNPDVPF